MSSVYLDNEIVDFEGSQPKDLKALLTLLFQHLNHEERYVTKLVVDGIELSTNDSSKYPKAYSKVEVFTAAQDEAFREELTHVLNGSSGLVEVLDSFSGKILSQPWEDSVKPANSLVKQLTPFMKFIEALIAFGRQRKTTWADHLVNCAKEYHSSINLFTSATALRDPACVSDIAAEQLLPLVKKTINILNTEVFSYFEAPTPMDHEPIPC